MINDEQELTPDADGPLDSDESENGEPEAEINTDEALIEHEADELLEDESSEFDPAIPDELDVEAALAAVATLGDLAVEDEEEVEEEDEFMEAFDEEDADGEPVHIPEPVDFSSPPMMTLRRGQMASFVPALLLMAVGIWLTFSLTTSESPPDSNLLTAIAVGGIGITLLAQWLSSKRWSRGAFFSGALVLLVSVTAFLLIYSDTTQSSLPGLAEGWPLLLVAAGTAFVLTALFTKPQNGRLALFGLMVGMGGITAFAVTNDALGRRLVDIIGGLWPVVLVLVIIVLLLPVIVRRRG